MTVDGRLAAGAGAPRAGVFSVSQLHDAMRAALGSAGLERVWVRGVVSGLRRGPRFTSWELVEHGGDASEVRAVLCVGAFAADSAEITSALATAGLELADELEVALWGRLDPNPAFGRLRLLAEGVDPRASVGAAVLARERVVAELEACGQLQAQQARDLPPVLRRVGLVSLASAAGRGDVLAVLGRAAVGFEVVEASAPMGGPQAPAEVARALQRLAGGAVDVIVIARGGGALCPAGACPPGDLSRCSARPSRLGSREPVTEKGRLERTG